MPAFPTYAFDMAAIRLSYREPLVPKGVGQQLGDVRGIYLGFTPQVTPGSDILTLAVDVTAGISLLKVPSPVPARLVDLLLGVDVDLNFGSHTSWPVYVIARAEFLDTEPTNARIITRASTAVGSQEVLICKVDKPAADLVVTQDVPANRHLAVAFNGQPFGYMLGGSITQLAAAVSALAEITAARLSPYTAPPGGAPGVDPWPSLSDRIAGDLAGSAQADRLARRFISIISNDHAAASGTSWNVSGSFSAVDRDREPKVDFPEVGSEVTSGAITSPTDAVRNVCFVVDADTGLRLVDSNRDPVFGRLSYASGTTGGGTSVTFQNSDPVVTGIGNPFAGLQVGDLIYGGVADDHYYEIETTDFLNAATLKTAYQGGTPGGPPVVVADPPWRRFTLAFLSIGSGVEAPVNIAATDIRFYFPSFLRLDEGAYDALSDMRSKGERPPTPTATSTAPGVIKLVAAGAKAGCVRYVQDNGLNLAGGNFATLNFPYAPGATDMGGGVANIEQTGAKGPDGEDANKGPDGPTGNPGPGYTAQVPYVLSNASVTPTVAGAYPVTLSQNIDFSTTAPALSSIAHVSIGWGEIADGPIGYGFPNGSEQIDFDPPTVLGTVVSITAHVVWRGPAPGIITSTTSIRLYVGACE